MVNKKKVGREYEMNVLVHRIAALRSRANKAEEQLRELIRQDMNNVGGINNNG